MQKPSKNANRLFPFALAGALMLMSMGCGDDDDHRVFEITGYIFGYHPCRINDPYQLGNGLLISTPTDTLLTFNFPENIVDFPPGIFANNRLQWVFDPQATEGNPEFKVRIRYRKATEVENAENIIACQFDINLGGFRFSDHVIILSAEKIR